MSTTITTTLASGGQHQGRPIIKHQTSAKAKWRPLMYADTRSFNSHSEDCGHLCCTEAWTQCRIIFSVGCMWPNQPIPPVTLKHICKKLDNARLQQPHTYIYGKDRTDGRMDETHSPAPIQAEQQNWRKLSLHECWWLAGWEMVLLHHSCIPCHSK